MATRMSNAPRNALTFPDDTDWPVTVSGLFDLGVERGEVYADGLSEIAFGSIEVADGYYLVETTAAVIRASGLTRDQVIYAPAMTLTLSGLARETEPGDAPAYCVVALAPATTGSRPL